jgi:hypothetical protein
MVRFSRSSWTDPFPMRSMPPQFETRFGGQDVGAGGHSLDELHLALVPHPDMPPYSIEGAHFYTFNQIESTEK